MRYVENPEKAAGISERAVARMAELGVPANPLNYEVWYNYYRGDKPELTRAVDDALARGGAINEGRLAEIHYKFLDVETDQDGGERVERISGELERQIDDVLRHMRDAKDDNEGFGESLAGFSEALAEGATENDAGSLVRKILLETQNVVAKSKALERKLEESSEQIGTLQQSLQEIRQEAQTDGLTGIANRKCFDTRLHEEAMRASEDGSSLCLLLTDIDHFKKFNDTFGHSVGDSVLKVVAKHLTDNVKGADLAARYGGEEFAVILPQTVIENAVTLAQQIREKLAKKELKSKTNGESYGNITLSIGVSRFRPGEPLSDLIDRADQGLYRAKELGRNRVVHEGELIVQAVAAGS
jgi:diguanylate cyclase